MLLQPLDLDLISAFNISFDMTEIRKYQRSIFTLVIFIIILECILISWDLIKLSRSVILSRNEMNEEFLRNLSHINIHILLHCDANFYEHLSLELRPLAKTNVLENSE